jgi:putative hydrolase of HD superfamily
MLLVHDIGEIDAGDTMVFVEGGWEQRKAAELASVTRIFGLLPPAQCAAYLALWQEFEDAQTPESRFAHSVDRAMPVLLNLNNKGQSWRENNISYDRVVRRVAPEVKAGCPSLWDYLAPLLEEARHKGFFAA